jgi:beta-lactam-binding protein with PASTA domain
MDFENLKTFFKSKIFLRNLRYALIGLVSFMLLISIFLRIFTLHGRSLTVPDFTGMTIKQVEDLADDKNLKFEIIDSVFDRTVPPGTVVDQNPKPGSNVKKHRNIFIYINATNPEMVKMPDLIGITLRVASSTLQTAGLDVGSIRYVPDIAQNTVLSQKYRGRDIAKGDAVPRGAHIDLVLGQGTGGQIIKVPELQGSTLSEARNLLIEAFLNVGKIEFDKTVKTPSDSAKAVVYQQNPQHGGALAGAFVDIWLTTDQSKVKANESETEEDESMYE